MKGTKEFYDLQNQFEKDVKTLSYGNTIERENKSEKSFYKNGYINDLFKAYMLGYSYKKMKGD